MDGSIFTPNAPGILVDATDALGRKGRAFVPNPLPPKELSSKALRLALSEADQEIARLDGMGRQIERPELLFGIPLRNEAVLSSAIEGTHTTLADLVRYEATRRPRSGDDLQVESYVKALEYGRRRVQEIPTGSRLFCELHEILMEHSDRKRTTPGHVRDCMVFIGKGTFEESRFVPPPSMFVGELIDNLARYLSDEDEAALIKLAVAHYQFETIHPFRDGNGRIGRLLIALWLHQQNILTTPTLFLSAYFEKNRNAYYDALLKVSTDGAWEAWLIYFLRGVTAQSRDTCLRTKKLIELRDEYKRRLTGPRASTGPSKLVDDLFAIPAISVPSAARILGVTYAAAKATVAKLVEAKILSAPEKVHGVSFYYAEELIELIEAPIEV